jgi:hypothetical protein
MNGVSNGRPGEGNAQGGSMSLRTLVSTFSLTLLLIPGWKAFPQTEQSFDYDSIRAVVYIVPQPLKGEQDLSFLDVLTTALRIELERAGLEVRIPEEGELASLAVTPILTLLERARGAGTDILFVEGYTSEREELQVEIVAYGVEEGDRMASVTARSRIGLRLDEAITQAADTLLPQLETRIASAMRRRQEAWASQPPVEVALGEQSQPESAAQTGLRPAAPAKPAEPEAPPSAEPGPAEAVRPERPLAWEAAAGAASFFPMPALNDVFKLGFLATAYLEHNLDTKVGTIGVGLYTGFTGFVPADPSRAAYFQSLVPVGLNLRWSTSDRARLGAFVRILGGVAVNVSDQSKVGGRLTRVLPQFKAGGGLTVAFSRRVGISVEFLYEMLFYLYMVDGRVANDLIMGFDVPAIYVYTKW